MPFCSVCGAEVVDTAEICPKCGSRIKKPGRTLYRSRSDRWIAGVCGGIGEYSGIPPILIRLGMILFGFCLIGILVYIVAAVMMPEEPQTDHSEPQDTK